MTWDNILAIVAILISIYALYQTRQQNKNAQGQIELTIEQSISLAKSRITDLFLADDGTNKYNKAIAVAEEEYLNAYDKACSLYIDRKVDADRFKKHYHKCIKDIVECVQFRDKLNNVSSPYKALLKVYNEWNNLEK